MVSPNELTPEELTITVNIKDTSGFTHTMVAVKKEGEPFTIDVFGNEMKLTSRVQMLAHELGRNKGLI